MGSLKINGIAPPERDPSNAAQRRWPMSLKTVLRVDHCAGWFMETLRLVLPGINFVDFLYVFHFAMRLQIFGLVSSQFDLQAYVGNKKPWLISTGATKDKQEPWLMFI